jgi:hypothetical protein
MTQRPDSKELYDHSLQLFIIYTEFRRLIISMERRGRRMKRVKKHRKQGPPTALSMTTIFSSQNLRGQVRKRNTRRRSFSETQRITSED